MEDDVLGRDVRFLKSVGPGRAADFLKAGVNTVGDLLYYFPREYQDRTRPRHAGACFQGEIATLQGTVLRVGEQRPRRGMTVTKATIHDGLGIFHAVWFNQPFVKKNLPVGSRLFVTGKVEKGFGATQVTVADYELEEAGDPLRAGRLTPLYPLSGKLSQRYLRGLISGVIDLISGCSMEFLPRRLLRELDLPSLPEAWRAIHFPAGMAQAEKARERFIFEELFLYQLALALCRKELAGREKNHRYAGDGKLVQGFIQRLPYRLTEGQRRVWQEITADLHSASPMYRLLHGEVGAGKTVLAALALLKAAENGLQGVLMAPTEVLATQHFFSLKETIAPLGVRLALLTGRVGQKEKKEIYDQVGQGVVQILVGTQALIQENVRFHRLGLAIVDEQHRFGVRQRAALQEKGLWPDTLVMTATPIPRTLALSLYGDLDISQIKDLPPGRQPVQTFAVPYRLLPRAYKFLQAQVKAGRQGFIICPLVEDSEKLSAQSVISLAAQVAAGELKGCRVGVLHGRLPATAKEEVMAAFRQGLLDVLVATTVVEVGIDVPNAAVLLVLDAERFGLAQLHQLRGRVGRGPWPSYCVLVAEPKTTEGRIRLKALTAAADGFALAEEDLRLRGPGEFSGTRQAGLPEFKIADLLRDWPVLQLARQEALAWLAADPRLQLQESASLQAAVRRRFGGRGYLGVG